MTAFFVTATGTDIGKTFVTAGLIRHLRTSGRPVSAIKPVVSGFDPARTGESDPGVLLAAMGRAIADDEIAPIAPWRFAAPLSPDMAAAREGRAIDFDALVQFSRDAIARETGTLFIEGIGGIMVPLDARHTVLDLMAALRIPLIVVTGSYLGTISHTLTALDVLRRRGRFIAAIVVNQSESGSIPIQDTAAAIGQFAPDIPIALLPRNAVAEAFAELAHTIGIDRR